LLGRPNVGKSSMANKIIGSNRVITSPMSGTTRDSVDIQFEREGKKYVMIDTAGIKRPGKVEEDLDKFAVIRSADAAKRADIILLLVDASEGLVSQDIHVSSYAIDNHKPVIIVVNKWDLVPHTQDAQKKFETELRTFFKFLNYAPVVFVSALTGSNIQKIFNAMNAVDENMHKTIPSSLLNSVILKAQMDNEAPDFNGGRLKISYCTQSKDVPPTFVMFCNNPNYFHFSYQRYLENVIRTQFGFDNCPIKLLIRSKRDDMLKKK
nr:ribosome biogenesis GTPase Der [Bacilli bacterium]